MKNIILLLFLAAAGLSAYAQNGAAVSRITGQVVQAELAPLNAATIQVLSPRDSAIIKMALTTKNGDFEIEQLKPGTYLLSVSAVGFKSYTSTAIQLKAGDNKLPQIKLDSIPATLAEVTVVAKRPLIEYKIDKTVVNVEASITNAGTSAMDVLEKSPGVMVDRDGNISLKGKQGVLILIDNKPTYLGGQDLSNMLKNMSASELDQLEIMTQPPARYDASGNSGVINIRTKKSKQRGFNGNLSTSYIQGKYPKTTNSINANYKSAKMNVFGNYSYNHWEGFNILELNRKFKDENGNTATIFDQESEIQNHSNSHNFKGGMDFYLTKKTTLGFVLNGSAQSRHGNVNSHTNLQHSDGTLYSTNNASSANNDKWKNGGLNLNMRHLLNEKGREISADLDYITYDNRSRQSSSNYLYDEQGDLINDPSAIVPNPYILRGDLPSHIYIYSGKVDYTHPLKKEAKIEAGWKSSYVKTDNDAPYEFFENNQWHTDARTNHFLYNENINALYVNFSKQVKKLGIQTGLRLENTVANGTQVIKNEKFKRNYTELFPTAYLSYAITEKSQFGLSFGRRIERPNYEDMNPFQRILDQFTYQQGNPYLRPQFSRNIELSYNLKGIWNFNLNYTNVKDIIEDILKQDDEAKTTFQTKDNIASSKNFGFSVSYNKSFTKWWTISLYGNAFYNKFAGLVNNAQLEADMYAFMMNFNNTFKFPHGWGGELSGFYRTQTLEGGLIVANPMGVFNLGVSKQILKEKGSLRLNIRDPFWIQRFSGYTRFDNIDVVIKNRWDNRRIGLTFSYRFGKGQQAAPKRKTGSASDEQNRVGGSQQQ